MNKIRGQNKKIHSTAHVKKKKEKKGRKQEKEKEKNKYRVIIISPGSLVA
jgi:hypothetical protein